MNNKILKITLMTAATMIMMSSTVLAAGWEQDSSGWKWENANGTYAKNSWVWDDWNNDGSQECYYFGDDGYMLSNTITPDGYFVDPSGAWVVPGQAYMDIYNKCLEDPDRHPRITRDMDYFSSSDRRLDFIDRGAYYELPDVKITATKQLDLSPVEGKNQGDHITLEGIEYVIAKIYEDGGYGITPVNPEDYINVWDQIDIRGDYCVAVTANDYTLQEVLYDGSLFFAKDAVIKNFIYQGHSYGFKEMTIPEIINMTEDTKNELYYPPYYFYGRMTLDKNGLVTRFEQFYTP